MTLLIEYKHSIAYHTGQWLGVKPQARSSVLCKWEDYKIAD